MTKAYRVALFLPSITSTVAVSMVWLWIFNPDMGLLNNFLTVLGFNNPPMWLASTEWSKPALVIMRVWQMCGYYMIMFLAGLQTIPESLYEAAEVDGANAFQRFFKITLPGLSSVTFLVVTLGTIWSFQVFDLVYTLTSGGPGRSTMTLVLTIYNSAFKDYKMGYASMVSVLLLAVVLLVSMLQKLAFRQKDGRKGAAG